MSKNRIIADGADVATRTALAVLPSPAAGDAVYLTESGREGVFVFSSANLSTQVTADTQQGVYVAPTSASTGASGAWVRKFAGMVVAAEWFGAVGDGTTNDKTAIQAAIDYVVSQAGGTVLFKAKVYKHNTGLLWSGAAVTLQGAGCGVQPTGGTTLLSPTGLSGAVIPQNGVGGLGMGSQIRDLRIKGAGVTPVSDADAALGVGAGLLIQANSTIVHNAVCEGFEGNGAYIYTTGAAGINANNCMIDGLKCYSNLKNGFAAQGADSNSCAIIKLDCTNNTGAGVYENSTLGNTYYNPHFAGNGSGATAVPILIGTSGKYNRFYEVYKEVHADSTLLFRTLTGGGGQNVIHYQAQEGSVAAPSTFTVDDQVGDTNWGVQNVNRQAFFGGDGANGTTQILDGFVKQRKGTKLRMYDSAEGFIWDQFLLASGKIAFDNGGVYPFTIGTDGFGYGAGVGGTVTQATSKATGVTLNTPCGQVVTHAASLAAATSVSFTLTNSKILAHDEIGVWIKSGATADAYTIDVTAVAAGSCRIQIRNESGGALGEALTLGFAIRKTVIN
ncbi:MAG: hypothetical protein M3R04_02375 [bacterium]|nr:hypothetical protein [bacterium]